MDMRIVKAIVAVPTPTIPRPPAAIVHQTTADNSASNSSPHDEGNIAGLLMCLRPYIAVVRARVATRVVTVDLRLRCVAIVPS
jgi:hypothetical protein